MEHIQWRAPFFDKYAKEDEKNDLNILNDSTSWEELQAVMHHEWYVKRQKATKVTSI